MRYTISKFSTFYARLAVLGLVPIALATVHLPAFAQNSANFGVITLSSPSQPPQGATRGHTQGAVPLASITRNDNQGNLCVGFAASEPDHILQVDQDLGAIAIRVDSNGGDTTLLVQAEDGRTWCGDDVGNSTDARVQINNLASGDYRVWVGSFDPGTRYQYQLIIN
ncbi:MAG: hypothetical protein AAGA75_07615 [Cyanobacteria bacterium P01_E01_bin.6]